MRISPDHLTLSQVRWSTRLRSRRVVKQSLSSGSGWFEPIEAEARDVVRRGSNGGEIGDDFSHHRSKLESVTGARRHDDDRPRAIDDEIAVRGHRVEARPSPFPPA